MQMYLSAHLIKEFSQFPQHLVLHFRIKRETPVLRSAQSLTTSAPDNHYALVSSRLGSRVTTGRIFAQQQQRRPDVSVQMLAVSEWPEHKQRRMSALRPSQDLSTRVQSNVRTQTSLLANVEDINYVAVKC